MTLEQVIDITKNSSKLLYKGARLLSALPYKTNKIKHTTNITIQTMNICINVTQK